MKNVHQIYQNRKLFTICNFECPIYFQLNWANLFLIWSYKPRSSGVISMNIAVRSNHNCHCVSNADSCGVLLAYACLNSVTNIIDLNTGKDSSQDEYGACAIQATMLDDKYKGLPVQHRETQGYESTLFMGYFKPAIKYLVSWPLKNTPLPALDSKRS